MKNQLQVRSVPHVGPILDTISAVSPRQQPVWGGRRSGADIEQRGIVSLLEQGVPEPGPPAEPIQHWHDAAANFTGPVFEWKWESTLMGPGSTMETAGLPAL